MLMTDVDEEFLSEAPEAAETPVVEVDGNEMYEHLRFVADKGQE